MWEQEWSEPTDFSSDSQTFLREVIGYDLKGYVVLSIILEFVISPNPLRYQLYVFYLEKKKKKKKKKGNSPPPK